MSGVADLRGLSSWVEERAARVLEVGSTCALGGDASWDAVLVELGLQTLPPDERRRHIAEGAKRVRGALPIEVRWAISAIQERARTALRTLDMRAETPEENDLVRTTERRLHTLVDDVTKAHLARCAPAAPTTASIFANARATTPNYGGGVKAGMNQMKCTMCGGPRKTEELGPCVYCGGSLS